MKKYKDYHQNQITFLPPSLDQLIAPNHLVRVVDKFVSQLSSKIWEHIFEGGGAPAYPPRMMIKIILYAYCCKIFTSRPIARYSSSQYPKKTRIGSQKGQPKNLSSITVILNILFNPVL